MIKHSELERGKNRHSASISGEVVEISSLAGDLISRGFVWQNGTMIDVGTLGGSSGSAFGINERGQVVGEAVTATEVPRAFIWESGRITDLGTLGGSVSQAFGLITLDRSWATPPSRGMQLAMVSSGKTAG